MKKVFTFMMSAAVALCAMATQYTGTLTVGVKVEGELNETSQDATIDIDKQDNGSYTLSIKNFKLANGDDWIGVGNIVLTDMVPYTINGVTTIVANQNIHITDGDDPDIPFWLGPMLDLESPDGVPIVLAAQFDETNLKVDIDIDMTATIEQFINVKFNTQSGGGSTGIYGDVNGDGEVSVGDVSAIYDIILGL